MYRCGKQVNPIPAALGIPSAVKQIVVSVKYFLGNAVRVIIVIAVFGRMIQKFMSQVLVSLKISPHRRQ